MARSIRCACGEKYKVTRRNAGTRERCDECDRMIRFPELDDDVEALEEVDDERTAVDDDEDYHRQRNRGKPTTSKKHGVCFLCEEETKGKFHTFFAGFVEDVDRSHNYWSGETTVRTTYSNVHKTGVFLCKPCAVAAWRRHFMLPAIGWAIPFGFFAFLTLVFLLIPGARPAAIPLLIFSGVFGALWGVPMYRLLNPSLQREVMERVAIGVARNDMIENNEGDSFFTTAEFRENFGRSPGVD